jgi:hypothetical protein
MILFSKRQIDRNNNKELINNHTETRLLSVIKSLTSPKYIEQFLLIKYKGEKEEYYLNEAEIDRFCKSELGYIMTDFFDFNSFSLEIQKESDIYKKDYKEYHDHYKLFDLIEILIIFSNKTAQDYVINKFNNIFQEEKSNFEIQKYLIVSNWGTSLEQASQILKDNHLVEKIRQYYFAKKSDDHIGLAKISSDIRNIIFSEDDIKKNQKIQDTLKKISSNIVSDKPNKVEDFYNIIDTLFKHINDITNSIYNIRHTEQTTIHVKSTNSSIYNLISTLNIAIVEFIIMSLKDEFLITENWEMTKEEYIKFHEISIDKMEEYYKLEEIPF